MRTIRLLMVDDHNLFRESLSRHFETDRNFEVVGQYTTVSELLDRPSEENVDVILLDYELGREQSCSRLPELKRSHPAAKVLMVTAGMPDAAARRAMEDGASGIFLKHGGLGQLIDAIRRVANGEVWVDAAIAPTIFNAKSERSEKTRSLTPRQNQVLRGVLDGLTNKEIAWNTNVSESAVKAVIQELFHKAGVRTRSQLVRIALEQHSSDWLAAEET